MNTNSISMTNKAKRLILISLVLLVALGYEQSITVQALKPKEPTPGPSLSLNAYGKTALTHDKREPLLLSVGLANPYAANVISSNRVLERRREELERTGVLKGMTKEERKRFDEQYKLSEVSIFVLGSENKTIAELISFRVTDSAGNRVRLAIRPLKVSAALKGPKMLDEKSLLHLLFGADPDILTRLGEGRYSIQAVLDTRNEKGMWQGEVVSEPITVTVASSVKMSREEMDLRDESYGRYYLHDQGLDKVESYIQRLFGRDHESVAAWGLRGDLLDAQGKSEEALVAFKKAHELFISRHRDLRREYGSNPPEPRYLLMRIQDLSRAIEKAKRK